MDIVRRHFSVSAAAGLLISPVLDVLAPETVRIALIKALTEGFGLTTMSAWSAAVSYGFGLTFVRHAETSGTLEGFEVNLRRPLSRIARGDTR